MDGGPAAPRAAHLSERVSWADELSFEERAAVCRFAAYRVLEVKEHILGQEELAHRLLVLDLDVHVAAQWPTDAVLVAMYERLLRRATDLLSASRGSMTVRQLEARREDQSPTQQ